MRKHYPLDPATGVENAALLPWANGVPSTGTEGSYPPFALCTDAEAEILNAQAVAGLPPSTTDNTQLAQALSIGLWLGTFGGTANALTATLQGSVNFPALVPGMRFHGIVGASANTAATTLSISGFATNAGVKPARKSDGATELGSGDLKVGGLATWVWDGAAYRLTGLAPSDILSLAPLNRVAFPSSTSAALTPASKGSYNYGYVNSPTTYTLPECTAFGVGYIGFLNNNNQGITVNAAAGAANTNQIVFGNNQNATQAVLSKTKAWLVLFCDGNNWTILSADPSINAKIGTTRTASQGYEILDNGTIRQWGTITSTGGNDNTFAFPTAFPNGCDHVDVNPAPGAMTANYSLSYLADNYTKTGFTLRPRYNSNGTTGVASNSFTFEARGN